MQVFIHEDVEKNKDLEDCKVYEINKRYDEKIYLLNKKESGKLLIIYAINIPEGEIFKEEKFISIYSLENRCGNEDFEISDTSMECWIGDYNKKIRENLLLINSIYEKENISDILLDKYIIIIPGGGIVIRLDGFNHLKIIYKKQKI